MGPPAHAPGNVIAVLYGSTTLASAVADLAACVPLLRQWAGLVRLAFAPIALVLVMAWLYAAWTGLPASHRGTVSPRRAALSLLVPFYGTYWAIAVNLALCDTLDGILTRLGSERRAPRALAVIAYVTWLGSLVVGVALVAANHPLSGWFSFAASYASRGLWLAYMVACDRARGAVARLGDRVATLGPPRLSELQRQPVPRALLGFCVFLGLIIIVLVWAALNPQPVPLPPTSGAT